MQKETKAIHSGTQFDKKTKGTNSPVYTSTAFGYIDTDVVYPRYFNTWNQQAVADKIAALENTEAALVFSSGMAAISSALFAFLKTGDHIIFQNGLYGGTVNWCLKELEKFGIEFTIADGNTPANFEKALQKNTKLLYIETPSNPLLKITDIKAAVNFAKANNLLTAIDNTFASPVNQNPADFGIDLVLHSATKYLGGHSDICAGALAASKEIISQVRQTALNFGGSLDSQVCYLLERSIKTIFIRVQQQNKNALQTAEFLNQHTKIAQVFYPGLTSHEGHETAKKQMHGFGGMLAFALKDGDIMEFQKNLQLILPAVSLGGVDSIISAPILTSHKLVPEKERLAEGITDKVLRLSVGIENAEDLIEDLEKALDSI
ncbi:MAG: PLP-dependent aspartate aminotransferase family protein [Draconibacterium sp.]|nr:PLP-dependent aspartate aminotransferase family protein [Draconibacterium sp.]